MIRTYSRLPVPEFKRWLNESRPAKRHWEKVRADADGAKSLTLILKGYRPYLPTDQGVTISAFYTSSNALHAQYADSALYLPIKPLLAGYGIGSYTGCGLIAVENFGTMFACEVIACDEEPDTGYIWDEYRPFSAACGDCGACRRACPVAAIEDGGRVSTERCLRAQAQYTDVPFPDRSRELIGSSIWGCDICMNACKLNKHIEPEKMPPELENALDLGKLLSGDVITLGKWIGTNYARKARMAARAAMVAANLGKREYIPLIAELRNSPLEFVSSAAEWALARLK